MYSRRVIKKVGNKTQDKSDDNQQRPGGFDGQHDDYEGIKERTYGVSVQYRKMKILENEKLQYRNYQGMKNIWADEIIQDLLLLFLRQSYPG